MLEEECKLLLIMSIARANHQHQRCVSYVGKHLTPSEGGVILKGLVKFRGEPKESDSLRAGSCENGISDSIPILILGNHRFQNFWKGTHVKIESE